jgi:ribosomal protein L13
MTTTNRTYAPKRSEITREWHVIDAVNAAQVTLTGAKVEQKKYYRHSGYPGGLKTIAAKDELGKRPTRVVERAIKGMLPHTVLGSQMYKKLRVYPGPAHPHAGQIARQSNAGQEQEATS